MPNEILFVIYSKDFLCLPYEAGIGIALPSSNMIFDIIFP